MTVDMPHDNHDQTSDLDLIQAEVATEGKTRDDLPDGAVLVPLGDTEVAVLHPDDWPSSANEDYPLGRFLTWARKVLATPDDVAAWETIDPTNREVGEFQNRMNEAFGVPKANPSASPRSSRTTRGR